MKFYNISEAEKSNIDYPDIYFTPQYGRACEHSDNAKWELCKYKDLIFVYLKKEYIFNNTTYYDLLTPYGYSGFYYKNDTTLNEFIPLFRNFSKENNYLTEVIRQNPYINISINKHYDTILSRTTFGIELKFNNIKEYLKETHKDNRRGYNIAIKNNLIFKLEKLNNKNITDFIKIYNITMKNLNSTNYYYFNENYFNSLINDNSLLANVYHLDKLIASCIIFKYNKFLHYHIGGSLLEYRNLRPNNFLHIKVIEFGINNHFDLYHLGGGLKDYDSLYNFKNKISNKKYNYIIHKNILNNNIYELISKKFDITNYFPIHRK